MCTMTVMPTRPVRVQLLLELPARLRPHLEEDPLLACRRAACATLRSPLSTFFFWSVLRFLSFLPFFLTGALSMRALKRTLHAISHSAYAFRLRGLSTRCFGHAQRQQQRPLAGAGRQRRIAGAGRASPGAAGGLGRHRVGRGQVPLQRELDARALQGVVAGERRRRDAAVREGRGHAVGAGLAAGQRRRARSVEAWSTSATRARASCRSGPRPSAAGRCRGGRRRRRAGRGGR